MSVVLIVSSSLHELDVSGTLSNIKLNSLFLLYFIYFRLEIKVQVPRVPDVCVYHVHIYSTITYTHEASHTHSVMIIFFHLRRDMGLFNGTQTTTAPQQWLLHQKKRWM